MECAKDKLINQHLCKMTELRDKLAQLGKLLTDTNFTITILTSLPSSWDTFVSSIDLVTLHTDSLEAWVVEGDHQQKACSGLSTDAVLAAKLTGKSAKHSKNAAPGACFNCGKPGHMKQECLDLNKSSGPNQKWKGRKNQGQGRAVANQVMVEPTATALATWMWLVTEQESATVLCRDEVVLAAGPQGGALWFADSGVTAHVVHDKNNFINYRLMPGAQVHSVRTTPAPGQGDVCLVFNVDRQDVSIVLHDCIHVPDFPHNLISLLCVTDNGFRVLLMGSEMHFFDPNGNIFTYANKRGRLYQVRVKSSGLTPRKGQSSEIALAACSLDEWHCILAHTPADVIWQMHEKGLVTGLDVNLAVPLLPDCLVCIVAKQTTWLFLTDSHIRADRPSNLIILDVCDRTRYLKF